MTSCLKTTYYYIIIYRVHVRTSDINLIRHIVVCAICPAYQDPCRSFDPSIHSYAANMAPVFPQSYNHSPSWNLCFPDSIASQLSGHPHGNQLSLYSLRDESKWLDCHCGNTFYDVDDNSQSDSTVHASGDQRTSQDWRCGSVYRECKFYLLLFPSLTFPHFTPNPTTTKFYLPISNIDRAWLAR